MNLRNRKDKVADSEADVTSVSGGGIFDDVTDSNSTDDDISLDSFSSKTVVFEKILANGEIKEESKKSSNKKSIQNPFKSIGENLKKNLSESKNSKASVRESISEDFDGDSTEEVSGRVSDKAFIDETAKAASDTSGEEAKSTHHHHHHRHHSHSSTSEDENKKSDSESSHHHHHSHSSTGEGEADTRNEAEIKKNESIESSSEIESVENVSSAESTAVESKIAENVSSAESTAVESKIAENVSSNEAERGKNENTKEIKSESHHRSKSESDSKKSDGEKSSRSHHHSSGSESSSHHHHHHHHHHSSKESDHEYEVSYGKYNFSVNPDEEDVPVAKYRKISKRKQEQEKRKQELEKKKKPKSKAFIIFMRAGITVVSILLVVVISLVVMINMGKNSLLEDNQDLRVKVPASVEMYDDYIIYKGHKYKYNENVATILFSGIDKKTKEHNEEIFGTAGQADSIFVLALDTSTGSYKLMALSRDSMVDVNICDAAGNFKGTQKMQICLAHAYGDGAETSNLNLKRSISRLFFGIPVNAYMSVDLDVIPILNDDVGGVTVTVMEDLTSWNPIFRKGETITLWGTQAETYVRARDVTGDENQNNLRMERQKSYIDGFVDNAITLTRKDFSTPLMLYNDVADYSRTDIDATKISYLASVFLQRGFSSDEDLVKIPGKTVMGEKYAEYHVDTEAFFDIIIQAYYIRID